MGVLTRAVERRAAWQTGAHPRDPVFASWFGGDDNATGIRVDAATAMRSTAVLACVRIIAENLASIPLEVFKRVPGGKEPDPTHPIYSVLHEKPNRWQTSFEWRDYLVQSLLLRGKAMAEIFPSQNGYPWGELVPLHPDRVKVFRAPDGSRAFAYTDPKRGLRVILQDEMLYVPFMPDDGYDAKSPIQHAAESIGVALQAQRYNGRMLRHAARPGGILKHPGQLSEEGRKKLMSTWADRHEGQDNAGRTALLQEGMTFEAIGISAQDAQLMDTLKFSVEDIARVFLVQQHKVGALEHATFSNIEHMAIEFVTDTLRPHAVRFEQAFKRDLFSEEGRRTHFAEFNLEGLLRGDLKTRFEAYGQGRQWGFLTTNQILGRENMNPIGPEGDTRLVPLNMAVVDENGMSMQQRLEAVGVLVRAGFEPEGALSALHLPAIPHTGLVPVTVQSDEKPQPMKLPGRDSLPGKRSNNRARLMESFRPLFVDAATRLAKRDLSELRKAVNKAPAAAELRAWSAGFTRDQVAAALRMFAPAVRSLCEAIAFEAWAETGSDGSPDMERFAPAVVQAIAERIAREGREELQGEDLSGLVNRWQVTSRAAAIADRELAQASSAAAVEAFRQARVSRVALAVGDECALCCETAEAAPGESLAAGRSHPPLHEGCTCTIVIAKGAGDEAGS